MPSVLITHGQSSERPFVRANALRAWVATGDELSDDALELTREEAPVVGRRWLNWDRIYPRLSRSRFSPCSLKIPIP